MKQKTAPQIKTEIDRYYQLILLYLGLKLFLDNYEDTDFRFVGSEIKIKRENGNELNPDIILQYEGDNKLGLPIEVKRSLSDDNDAEKKLKKMMRYDEELKGWDTEDGLIGDHIVVFLPHYLDRPQAVRVYENTEDINFQEKDFLIWEWNVVQSTKYQDSGETMVIRLAKGELNIQDNVTDFLREEGIKIDLNDPEFLKNKEKTLFVRQDPPVEYTIVVLWETVLPGMEKDKYTIKDVREEIESKYTTNLMINVDGHSFRIEKKWIRKALGTMEELGLVEESEGKYKANFDKQIKKKFEEYICDRLGVEEDEDQASL